MVRGKLARMARTTLGALTVIDVHGKTVYVHVHTVSIIIIIILHST